MAQLIELGERVLIAFALENSFGHRHARQEIIDRCIDGGHGVCSHGWSRP